MVTTAQVSPSPHRKSSASLLFTLLIIVGVVLLLIGWAVSTYNRLASADQEVRARWSQVESVYQRRAELVPRLVQIVQSVAPSERFEDVFDAQAQVTRNSGGEPLEDAQAFQRYQEAQQTLSVALERVFALARATPELESTPGFRELQAQLEGTENRIAIERMRFNEAARQFNGLLGRFPTLLVARARGDRFAVRPLFQIEPGAQSSPAIRF